MIVDDDDTYATVILSHGAPQAAWLLAELCRRKDKELAAVRRELAAAITVPSGWEAENYRSFHVDVPRPDGSTARMIFYHPEDTGGEVDLAFRVAAIGCTQLARWAARNLHRAHVFSVTAGAGAKNTA